MFLAALVLPFAPLYPQSTLNRMLRKTKQAMKFGRFKLAHNCRKQSKLEFGFADFTVKLAQSPDSRLRYVFGQSAPPDYSGLRAFSPRLIWLWVKKKDNNSNSLNGDQYQNLRNPRTSILSHTHILVQALKSQTAKVEVPTC